eukprot:TRINITY_DN1017_c0_g1_i14.p1 TRINITY_DN1017_c0_g1~~TRINITY_DN1017_c0_g1_i14.p1  ORF type:complete len:313 (+),score=36.74 TRINITY_DN1017_c0_g1_i14:103-1041(+)
MSKRILTRSRAVPIKVKRCSWTKAEDRLLLRAVKGVSLVDWSEVAASLAPPSPANYPKKTAKQCRERWHNRLDPSIKVSPWSSDEIATFFRLFRKYGARWAKLAAELPGRTDNTIKNFFYCRLRKIARRVKKNHISDDMKNPPQEVEYNLFLINYLLDSYSASKDTSQPISDKYISDMMKSANVSYEDICKYLKEYAKATKACIGNSNTDESFSKQPSITESRVGLSDDAPAKGLDKSQFMCESDFLFIMQLLTIDKKTKSLITLPCPKYNCLEASLNSDKFQPTFHFSTESPYNPDILISSYLLCKFGWCM